jgi:hypothetical protein
MQDAVRMLLASIQDDASAGVVPSSNTPIASLCDTTTTTTTTTTANE